MAHLLGLDAGTTSIKAWLYDAATGQPVAGAGRRTPVTSPRPGWAEHDPEALWQAAAGSIRTALDRAPAGCEVAGLAVASMGEAGLPLDERGRPLYPIVAYYDARSDAYVEWWRKRMAPEAIHAISGQVLRPVFGVMKLLWLRDAHPDLFARARRWLSVADYLIRRLAGVDATDYTLASRTMLLDQRTRDWSGDLLDVAGLARDILPAVHPSGTVVGFVSAEAAAQTGLPAGTPVATGGHDHLCGALAAGVAAPGRALASFGTAAALLTPSVVFHGAGAVFARGLSCYCHVAGDHYVVQSGLGAAGAAQVWLARLLSPSSRPTPRGAVAPEAYAALERAAAESPPGARGLVCLPHLRGSGTPERDSASRAAFVGLREEHGAGEMWRALIESLACWARRNVDAIEAATAQPIERLTLIGGAARGALLPQALADVTGRAVELPAIEEASALGAALLAGQAVGVRLATPPSAEVRSIAPDAGRTAWYDRFYREVYMPLYEALRPINHALGELTNDRPPTTR
jgi:xylulokinase